ncbi:hypothetical protein BJ138DRAFT_1144230 [Hygrophoropsis aurantiaca]|uniref:Uncharacterized protein n=1 Tax=Hygrophoropsis aurantiaca TaxID=72124 RepID=A0ACB8ALN9_9AGAM|nr:hypothetical protein BJ138DRAFT_1144230 [Hygrophoropsis aurantiaca]
MCRLLFALAEGFVFQWISAMPRVIEIVLLHIHIWILSLRLTLPWGHISRSRHPKPTMILLIIQQRHALSERKPNERTVSVHLRC